MTTNANVIRRLRRGYIDLEKVMQKHHMRLDTDWHGSIHLVDADERRDLRNGTEPDIPSIDIGEH